MIRWHFALVFSTKDSVNEEGERWIGLIKLGVRDRRKEPKILK